MNNWNFAYFIYFQGSPAPPSNRAETPFPGEFPGMSNNQTNYFTGSQTTCSQQSPYSNCSPYSWNEQYSPKSVRRRLLDAPASPSNFVNKNRVLECDFIPSKKSRKKIKTEDSEYSPEMREEIKVRFNLNIKLICGSVSLNTHHKFKFCWLIYVPFINH